MKTMYGLFGETMQAERPPTPLKYLLRLRSTAEVERLLESCKTSSYEANRAMIPAFEAQLANARLRDELAAARPAGCWCLGLGGDDSYATSSGESYLAKTCTCPEGLAAQAHKEMVIGQVEQRKKQQRIEGLWESAGIPARFKDMRLGTSPLAKSNPLLIARLSRPHDVYEDYPDSEPPADVVDSYLSALCAFEGSWFFYGPFGVGKTGLAVGLAREKVKYGCYGEDGWSIETFQFVTVPRMLSELRSTYNRSQDDDTPSEAEVIDKYAKASLLILDDLGAEQIKSADWLGDRLYQIIGERHDELLPTIFTSNLTMDMLAKRIGERITWRIVEMVGKNIVHLDGPNLRA